MMSIEELQILMDRWLSRSISIADKERLRAYYLEVNGWDRHSCTTCPSFWWDVKQSLRYILLKNGIKTVEKQPKYILAEGVGEIRLFGSGTHYVMEGEESATTVIITDEVGDELAKNTATAEQLLLNPAYKGATEASEPERPKLTAKEKKALKEQQEAEKAAETAKEPEPSNVVILDQPDETGGEVSQDVVIPAV